MSPGLGTYALLIPLTSAFVVLCIWSYRFLFNHEIIRNYTNNSYVSKNVINSLIGQQANARYGCKLLHLDVEDELDEQSAVSRAFTDIHDRNIHRIVGGIFSVVIALSVELVAVFMVQLAQLWDVQMLILQFGIRTLVVLVTTVQPMFVISLYVNQDLFPRLDAKSPGSILRIVSTVLLCVLWYYLLHRIGELAGGLGDISEKSLLDRKTNEVALTGITITAILSGVACALTPIRQFWTERRNLAAGASKTHETRLNDLIQSYNSTKMLISKRQRELNAILVSAGGTVYNSPGTDRVRLLKGSGKQLLHKVQSFASISSFGGASSEEEELRTEIALLQLLKELIYADLTRELTKFLRTSLATPTFGLGLHRVVRAFKLVFAVYCVYRVFNVLVVRLPYQYFHQEESSAVDPDSEINKHTKDALAITLAKLVQSVFGYLPMSEVQLINQISFMVSGSLFVCSFQNVLVTFKSLGRFLPTHTTAVSGSVKSWLKNLVVSEFLAIYVIATALLIRTNLPENTAKLMLRILSLSTSLSLEEGMRSEVDFIDRWFDQVFGLTCVITFVVLLLKFFIESGNAYDDGYDEEMIMESDFKML